MAPLADTGIEQIQAAAEAQQAKQASRRSVDDVKQQQAALFSRRFTVENSLTYSRYDRKQVTLNGFLALDAIFLGNIAIENVESDTLTYNLAARWGVSPRLTLNLDVPYLAVTPVEFQTLQQWGANRQGLLPLESTIMIAIPELDGAIGSMVFGGRSDGGGKPKPCICSRAMACCGCSARPG